MSRQFRFYLLPSDIERLAAELRSRFGARFIDSVSPSMTPMEIDSCIRTAEYDGSTYVHCYLIPSSGAEIKMWHMTKRQLWAVDESSEVIQFNGCEYHGEVLEIGRFYFHTDILMGDAIWRKRPEFLEWADKVFRTTKRLLHRSNAMDAYLGEDALRWRKNGGRLASLRRADRTYLYEPDE
jgi:hypothetical protein